MTVRKLTPKTVPINFKRPKLFSSAYTRKVVEGTGEASQVSGLQMSDSNIRSSSSFRYDPPGVGLKSTQQIPVDWSLFENHTFFNSAEAKVNVSFDKMINEFPFDGTRQEYEEFLDGLTGFEKWVCDQFPKNFGFLNFPSSNQASISVNDFAGTTYPSLSKNRTGEKILDPGVKSLTIEFHLFLPTASNNNQVICQNLVETSGGGEYGYTIATVSTGSSVSGSMFFVITSGTNSVMSASLAVPKGQFNHLAFTLNRQPGVNQAQIFWDSKLVSTSSNTVEMGSFGFTSQSFIIASGVAHNGWTPSNSFVGVIDELRFFSTVRTETELLQNAKRNIFASDDLKLYFKFNEPTGSLGDLTNLVLDSSGNSLHSYITNFTGSMRDTGSIATLPLTYEQSNLNPVLFPAFSGVSLLNSTLLSSASLFDLSNPNLITKLVPRHYLEEGQYIEGFQTDVGDVGDDYEGTGIPGSGKMGSTHILVSFLYVWAKYFDELKMFIDQMSNILFTDYEEEGFAADQFLPLIFKYHGFDVPNLFSNATVDQFFNAENIGVNFDTSDVSLHSVQNQIWRRVLTNLGEITRSKGTIHAVKAFLRTVGINPDSSVRIREFGGPTSRNLSNSKQTKSEVSSLLSMSGSLANVSVLTDAQGIPTNKPFLRSAYLSGSRTEVGFPSPKGTFVKKGQFPIHGISNDVDDGLFTSGSWTYESIYKFNNLATGSHPLTQSLVRFSTTGSGAPHLVWANLLAISGTSIEDCKVKLFARPAFTGSAPLLEMFVTGVDIFDSNQWNVSFGRFRNDDVDSIASSSWFLRVGRQNMGEIVESYITSSWFLETIDISPALQRINSTANVSGSFFTVGSQSLTSNSTLQFLNNSSLTGSEVRFTDFTGQVGHFKFWSKGVTQSEWETHVRNFKSLGVTDPSLNFNFVTQLTGSFEKIRLDVSTDQPVTKSDSSGLISLFDFSQGNYHISGTGFETSRQIINPETFWFSFPSPKFDEASSDTKVRVRGFLSDENVLRNDSQVAPVYEIDPSEPPNDDTRFTIDFSVVDSLDEDIVKIFSTLESLDSGLGNPELLFSEDYPKLESLRDVYFNRLTNKMNLRGFFEFFKWFDSSIGLFIEQLVPRKTSYLGTNFVIESHVLERPKIQYYGEGIYLDEGTRDSLVTTSVVDLESSVKG